MQMMKKNYLSVGGNSRTRANGDPESRARKKIKMCMDARGERKPCRKPKSGDDGQAV